MARSRAIFSMLFAISVLSVGLVHSAAVRGKCVRPDDFPKAYVILTGEVNVVAVYSLTGEASHIDTGCVRALNLWVIASRGDRSFNVSFDQVYLGSSGFAPHELETIKLRTGWKGDYLFVPYRCEGTSWSCAVDHVFAIRDGKLVKIGIVSSDVMGPPGLAYRDGVFYGTYGRLEINPLTSHAGAPGFAIVMVEEDRRLVIDIEKTWQYGKGKNWNYPATLPKCEDREERPADQDEFTKADLLRKAALAKFCGRTKWLELAMAEAKCALGRKTFAKFREVIARVERHRLSKQTRTKSKVPKKPSD